MRIPIVLTTMLLAVQAWAMTPQYSAYVNYAADMSHIYATALVDGSTLCDPNCPPGAMHTGKVYLQLGNTGGGWVNGQTVTAPTYLSVSNSRTLDVDPGDTYDESDTEDVTCSIVGAFFQEGGIETVGIRLSAYVSAGMSGTRCVWSETCNGTCSTPFTTNTVNGQCFTPPNQYRQCVDLVLNGNYCFIYRLYCIGQGVPGVCD